MGEKKLLEKKSFCLVGVLTSRFHDAINLSAKREASMARKARKYGVSCSPVGLTTPISADRLKYDPRINDPEKVIVRMWADENTPELGINLGMIPLDHITHRCNSGCIVRKGDSFVTHHFTGDISDHDVEVVAATLQWLGTNCGLSFLRTFKEKLVRSRRSGNK